MIKINGTFKTNFLIELDVDSFDDISEEKMSIEQSNKLIAEKINQKYGLNPREIWVGREVKQEATNE